MRDRFLQLAKTREKQEKRTHALWEELEQDAATLRKALEENEEKPV
jgi:hypothetical protein